MKEIVSDPRITFKHQTLLQDYLELQKETELKRRTLQMMKQKRLTLIAEVRFLRRRYKHLKQEQQTLQTSPEMFRLSETHSGLRASAPCFDLNQKNTICNEKETLAHNETCDLENEVLTKYSITLPDLNENSFINTNVSGFDLNQISREEEEPEVMVAEATKNTILGNGMDDQRGNIKLPNWGEVEKVLNRGVKRRVSWQDPVALSV